MINRTELVVVAATLVIAACSESPTVDPDAGEERACSEIQDEEECLEHCEWFLTGHVVESTGEGECAATGETRGMCFPFSVSDGMAQFLWREEDGVVTTVWMHTGGYGPEPYPWNLCEDGPRAPGEPPECDCPDGVDELGIDF